MFLYLISLINVISKYPTEYPFGIVKIKNKTTNKHIFKFVKQITNLNKVLNVTRNQCKLVALIYDSVCFAIPLYLHFRDILISCNGTRIKEIGNIVM